MKQRFLKLVDNLSMGTTFLQPKFLWLYLFAAIFIFSTVVSLVKNPGRPATLWFPTHRGSGHNAELRYLKPSKEIIPEEQLLEELLLGPMSENGLALTSPEIKVNLVISKKKQIYMDISDDIFFGREGTDKIYEMPLLNPELVLDYIRKAVSWNFPGSNLVLTVDGRESLINEQNSAIGTMNEEVNEKIVTE